MYIHPSRRRTSSSNNTTKCNNNLNRSFCTPMTPTSNDSSLSSSCDVSLGKTTSFVDSDLLETNIKEIEYTLLGLMDNEAQAQANRNSQRLASISNVRNKLYSGESSGRRGRLGSINKNRKNSTNTSSNMTPESIQDILSTSIDYPHNQNNHLFHQTKFNNKENQVDPKLNDSLFLDTPPYFSSPESKSRSQYSSYQLRDLSIQQSSGSSSTHTIINNQHNTPLLINAVDHSSPRCYPSYDFLNSPKLSPSPTPYRKRNGDIIMVKTPCYYENNFNEQNYLSGHIDGQSKPNNQQNYNAYSNNQIMPGTIINKNINPYLDQSFQSPPKSNSNMMDGFNKSNQNLNSSSNSGKKSVKMSVSSNKRQILEEEFRKEKYPCNEKVQKLSIRLNMKYEEVHRYFKKRRTEEKETNNKFSNLVKLLNNYLETEE